MCWRGGAGDNIHGPRFANSAPRTALNTAETRCSEQKDLGWTGGSFKVLVELREAKAGAGKQEHPLHTAEKKAAWGPENGIVPAAKGPGLQLTNES